MREKQIALSFLRTPPLFKKEVILLVPMKGENVPHPPPPKKSQKEVKIFTYKI